MPEEALTAKNTEATTPVSHPNELRTVPGFLKTLFKRTMADKVPVLAAALSFFTMLSIVPVLLLALAILGFVMYEMGSSMQDAAHMAVVQMQKSINQVLPGANVQRTFASIAQQINLEQSLINVIQARGLALATGLLSLIWASLQIFVNASSLMNLAFDVDETRSWIKLRLVALGVTIGASLLFLLSLLPTSGPDFVRNLHIPWLGLPNPTPFWVDALFALVALAVNVTMFAFIYKFLPNTRVEWRDAIVGGLAMGVLWEMAKKGFALFLAGSNNPMYGAMGGVILLITWMYYTNILLLLGAEVAGLYRRARVGALAPEPEEVHRRELHAVHAGEAVPLSNAPAPDDVPLAESRKKLDETLGRIKGDLREVGETVRSTAHNVKTTPARHRATEAFRKDPSAEDRREMDVAPTAEERRPPEKLPRTLAGALGGATAETEAPEAVDPEAAARERERIEIEERAAREMREGDYPPVAESKQRARETVNEIRSNVQDITRSARQAREDAGPEPGRTTGM